MIIARQRCDVMLLLLLFLLCPHHIQIEWKKFVDFFLLIFLLVVMIANLNSFNFFTSFTRYNRLFTCSTLLTIDFFLILGPFNSHNFVHSNVDLIRVNGTSLELLIWHLPSTQQNKWGRTRKPLQYTGLCCSLLQFTMKWKRGSMFNHSKRTPFFRRSSNCCFGRGCCCYTFDIYIIHNLIFTVCCGIENSRILWYSSGLLCLFFLLLFFLFYFSFISFYLGRVDT